MRGIWLAFRAESRARWRAWVGLGVILGLTGGAAIATAAGARRTMTAYDRFLRMSNAADIQTGGAGESIDIQAAMATMEGFPEVAESARGFVVAGRVRFFQGNRSITLTAPEAWVTTELPPKPGRLRPGIDLNRFKVLEGRLPAPEHDDEAAVSFVLADRYGVKPGDRFEVVLGDPFGEPQKAVTMTVVGVFAVPGEFQGIGTLTVPSVFVPYTFPARYPDLMAPPSDSQANFTILRLRRGEDDYPSFIARLNRTPYRTVDLFRTWDHAIGVVRTMDIHAIVLLAATILLGLTGLAIFGQNVSRQIALGSQDHPTLRALGVSKRSLASLGLCRAAVSVLTGGLVAVVVALAASPLFPLGAARIADPDVGLHLDPYAVIPGLVLIVLLTMLIAAWPAIREARVAARSVDASPTKPSVAASAAQKLSAPPPIVAGLRLALEPGRGRAAVPVRSTIAGIAIAIAAIVGAVVLASSLEHLLDHPELGGQTYDAIVVPVSEELGPAPVEKVKADLPFIDAVGDGTVVNGLVGERDIFGVVFAENQPIAFSIIDGRAPTDRLDRRGLPEIALGVKTTERLAVGIGDVATVTLETHDEDDRPVTIPVRGRVVGRVAVPSFPFGVNPQSEGFAMSLGTLNRYIPGEGGCCFARFEPGTDRDRAADLATKKGYQLFFSNQRADLNTLAQLQDAPLLLAGFFGLVGLAVLIHTLVTAIRRRRRDLAVLKTLGFMRAQARRAVAVQASAIALLAIVLGVPGGLILGRWGWRFFALSFGVVPAPIAPLWFLVAVVPAILLLANLVAVFPARAAAGTKPALILRAE